MSIFICLWQFVNLGYSILVGCERKSCYLVLLVKSFKTYFVWLLCHHHKKSFSHASVLRHGVLGYETQWFKKINKYKHACVAKGCVTELWQFQSIVNRQGICPDEGCLSSKLRPICQCQPVFLFWLQGHVSPSLQNDFHQRKNSLFKKKKKTFYLSVTDPLAIKNNGIFRYSTVYGRGSKISGMPYFVITYLTLVLVWSTVDHNKGRIRKRQCILLFQYK